MSVRHVCAQCGTTAYNQADMVGNVCPQCWQENLVLQSVQQTLETAKQVQARIAEQREDRKDGEKVVAVDNGVPIHPAGEPTPPTDDSQPKKAVVRKTAKAAATA